ncbi:uncharacterized protein LOC107143226 isoform X1 [Marmota marmota marmota]|uniref:uncharacterized protein LOC107143226 isoform X1 n=1 Tax=Marmota marmota marmota TaxID=9994 RepID=UPI002093BED8|nr:uncharacterized protein LOC107143226 isoform X1 [Marmota marmota marmota]
MWTEQSPPATSYGRELHQESKFYTSLPVTGASSEDSSSSPQLSCNLTQGPDPQPQGQAAPGLWTQKCMTRHSMRAAQETVTSHYVRPWDPSTCLRRSAFRWTRGPTGGQQNTLKTSFGPGPPLRPPRSGKSAPVQKASAATSHQVMPGCEPYKEVSRA